MDKYIGFDIDTVKTAVCVIQKGNNEKFYTIGSDIDSMIKFLKKQKKQNIHLHLTFEISGQAGYLYDTLVDYVDTITVSNPSKMTWIYRTAKKNDRIDARKQALLLSIGEIPKVHIPCKKVRQWRETILHRRNLIGRAVQVKNRIRALLKNQGFAKPMYSGSWWKKENIIWMQTLANVKKISAMQLWKIKLTNLLEQLELLDGQIKIITNYLDCYLSKHPGGKLLMSIPGVGPRTSEAVLAYTDDIRRFKKAKQYCSYFGLTPKLDESGNTKHMGHISKQGPSVVRWLVGESAWRVIKQSPSMKSFYENTLAGQPNRKKIAIVAVARKLLTIMRAMMLSGELYNEQLVSKSCYTEFKKTA
jgi:transposase